MNDKLKALYNRVSCDPSQLQKFVKELCEALGNGEEGFVTVNSEGATEGQVLTADGNGGTSWQEAQGGGITEGEAKEIAQKSRNILTDVEYKIVNGSTTILLPSGVYPLFFYQRSGSTQRMMNCINGKLISSYYGDRGEILGSFTRPNTSGQVQLTFPGISLTKSDYDYLLYIDLSLVKTNSYMTNLVLNPTPLLNWFCCGGIDLDFDPQLGNQYSDQGLPVQAIATVSENDYNQYMKALKECLLKGYFAYNNENTNQYVVYKLSGYKEYTENPSSSYPTYHKVATFTEITATAINTYTIDFSKKDSASSTTYKYGNVLTTKTLA